MSQFASENSAIVKGTEDFFRSLTSKDFHAVEDFLSPDCRLQDQFGEGRGVSGSDKCMEKIRELQGKLQSAGLNKMENTTMMRNQLQVRFMLRGKVGFMKVVIGFAIEWSCGIISLLVIIKNADPESFMLDTTSAPSALPEVPADAAPEPSIQEEASEDDAIAEVTDLTDETELPIQFPDHTEKTADKMESIPVAVTSTPVVTTSAPVVAVTVVATAGTDGGKWYPGKLLKERRSSVNTSIPVNPNHYWTNSRAGDYEVVMQSLGVTLQPPYLVSRPPPVPAAITVTVHRSANLKSRLVRLITRPVNSYVTVSVAGRSRSTPIVSKSSNPNYAGACPNGENIFMFELPNSVEFRREGCIEFTIKDKHLREEDVLAEIMLPVVSIKCKIDHSVPTDLQLSTELFSKHTPRIGKKFRERRQQSHDGGRGVEEMALLDVSISKVDIMMWWVLEEMKARDEARERALAEEKMRKAIEAERKQAEDLNLKQASISGTSNEPEKKEKKKSKPANKKGGLVQFHGTALDESEWRNGDSCHSCKADFSFTLRKHHCRLCGEVYCDPCSCTQVVDDYGAHLRACSNCHSACERKAASVLEEESAAPSSTASSVSGLKPTRVADSDDELDEDGDTPASTEEAALKDEASVEDEEEDEEEEAGEDSDDEAVCIIC